MPTERPAAWRPRSRVLPDFEPGVRVAGVIANQGGSERHRAWLSESLAGHGSAAAGGHVAPRIAAHACPAGIWDW